MISFRIHVWRLFVAAIWGVLIGTNLVLTFPPSDLCEQKVQP